MIGRLPSGWVDKAPVFLPTRELLTIYPGFVSVYENHYLEFEETWRDTCLLLGAPAVRGPKERRMQQLLGPLEEAMGGKVELDKNGRFYLNIPAQGSTEMHLVAEGHRKLAMIARLIATASLLDKGYLFWDEPETNLNPKLIKEAARTVLHLCRNGIQVIIATHSLFLMREVDILMQTPDFKGTKSRFIGLQHGADGIDVEQGDTIDEIGAITALDEDLRSTVRPLHGSWGLTRCRRSPKVDSSSSFRTAGKQPNWTVGVSTGINFKDSVPASSFRADSAAPS